MSRLKEVFLVLSFIFAGIFLIYTLSLNNGLTETGKVTLDLDLNYQEGQALQGTLKLSLKEGELIPVDSKIILENSGESFEYSMDELVSESPITGNFYIEGKNLSGAGEGFGLEGEKITYPRVYFKLNILPEESNVKAEEEISEEQSNEEISQDETPSNENETAVDSETQESSASQSVEKGETTSENIETTTTTNGETEITAESSTETTNVQEVSEVQATSTESKKEEKREKEEKKEEKSEEKSESKSEEATPITGGFILDFSRGIFNIFLRLTGQASLETENPVEGDVSQGEEFTYKLNPRQTANIIPGSVRTESKKISDDNVNIKIDVSNAIVTTSYFEKESGFGEEYLGDNEKEISIDITKLNFTPKEGGLSIRLVNGEEEILILITNVAEGNISSSATTEINETSLEFEIQSSSELTDEERKIILSKLGNSTTLKVTKAEKTKEGFFVRMEIGNYWIEHYYPTTSDLEFTENFDIDKVRFLKDLARELSQTSSSREQIEGLIGDVEF